jgi:hypothetical protein
MMLTNLLKNLVFLVLAIGFLLFQKLDGNLRIVGDSKRLRDGLNLQNLFSSHQGLGHDRPFQCGVQDNYRRNQRWCA